MFRIKYSNSLQICINICLDVIKPDSKRNLVSVPKTAPSFSLFDKCPFGSTKSLKFLKNYINVFV